MLKFLILSLIQSLLLASAQVSLKLSLVKIGMVTGLWQTLKSILHHWPCWTTTGVLFLGATALWLYILRHFPFSIAYPLTSIAYVFGMLLSMILLKEAIPPMRWIGVGCIVVGVFFMLKH